MDVPELVKLVPPAYIYTVAGLLAMALVTVSGIMFKAFTASIKSSVKAVKAAEINSNKILEELEGQRTNCLTTLQEQGKEQIDLLTKLVEGQAHQSGLLEGVLKSRSF